MKLSGDEFLLQLTTNLIKLGLDPKDAAEKALVSTRFLYPSYPLGEYYTISSNSTQPEIKSFDLFKDRFSTKQI